MSIWQQKRLSKFPLYILLPPKSVLEQWRFSRANLGVWGWREVKRGKKRREKLATWCWIEAAYQKPSLSVKLMSLCCTPSVRILYKISLVKLLFKIRVRSASTGINKRQLAEKTYPRMDICFLMFFVCEQMFGKLSRFEPREIFFFLLYMELSLTKVGGKRFYKYASWYPWDDSFATLILQTLSNF